MYIHIYNIYVYVCGFISLSPTPGNELLYFITS